MLPTGIESWKPGTGRSTGSTERWFPKPPPGGGGWTKVINQNQEFLFITDLSHGNIHLLTGVTLFPFRIKQLSLEMIFLFPGVNYLFRGVFSCYPGMTPLFQRNILPFHGGFHSLRGMKLSRFGVKNSTDSDFIFDRNCKR